MFTYRFWRFAFERALKTFLQTMVALLSVGGIGLFEAPWGTAFSAAGMAAMLSVLSSMASEPLGDRETPSLLRFGPKPGSQPNPKPDAQPNPKPDPQPGLPSQDSAQQISVLAR